MGNNKGDYIDFSRSYSPGRRGGKGNGGLILGIILITIVALGLGTTAYRLSKNKLPKDPTPIELERFQKEGRATPTDTPTPSPVVEGARPTDTPVPTPTPFVEPGFDDPYLVGFTDFRDKTHENIRGVYTGHFRSNNTELIDQMCWFADCTDFDAVVIDVKDDNGNITYSMNYPEGQAAGAMLSDSNYHSLGDIRRTIEILHSKGIYCIARIVTFRDAPYDTSKPEKTTALMETHPSWLLTTKARSNGNYVNADSGEVYLDGDGYTWINPYNREACEYIVDIAEQAVYDGFDEICFDYIRFPDKYIDSIFYGGEKEQVPLTTQIERFTKYACNRLKPLGAYVSVSTFGSIITSSIDEETVGQRYTDLAKYVDYICPMIYPALYRAKDFGFPNPNDYPYEVVGEAMKASQKKLNALREETGYAAKCRPWLQAYSYGGKEYDYNIIRFEIQACKENGVTDFVLWNQSVSYERDCFDEKVIE